VCCLLFGLLAQAQCPPGADRPGKHSYTMSFDGERRQYNLIVPTGYTNTQALPLIIVMHGYTDSPNGIERYSGFTDYAQEYGYLVVYPQGLDASWNAGRCCGTSSSRNVMDFEWIGEAIVDDIATHACVDRDRVYASGMSNGCMMSEGLACQYPDVFAAVGCHSGCMSISGGNSACDRDFGATSRIGVLEVHGTSDTLVPMDGNFYCDAVLETEEAWADRNGCGIATEYFSSGIYSCERRSGCTNGGAVEQCLARGERHTWFDDRDFSSTEFMLTFFGIMDRHEIGNNTVVHRHRSTPLLKVSV